MKNEAGLFKALGARKYKPQESILNFELSSNPGGHQVIESKDDALCMYDHAKEILELMENLEGSELDD